MEKLTDSQLQTLSNIFNDCIQSETFFKGYKIIVTLSCGEYDYEILEEQYRRGNWHIKHYDEGFESVDQARAEAEKWIANYEDTYDGPGDNYYAQ